MITWSHLGNHWHHRHHRHRPPSLPLAIPYSQHCQRTASFSAALILHLRGPAFLPAFFTSPKPDIYLISKFSIFVYCGLHTRYSFLWSSLCFHALFFYLL